MKILTPKYFTSYFINVANYLYIYHIRLDVIIKSFQMIGMFLTVSKLALGLWDQLTMESHQTISLILFISWLSIKCIPQALIWTCGTRTSKCSQYQKRALLGIWKTGTLLTRKLVNVMAKFYRSPWRSSLLGHIHNSMLYSVLYFLSSKVL